MGGCPDLDFGMVVKLGTLDAAQLDHLSLGLTNNFGSTITRPPDGHGLILQIEDGSKVGMSPECTVGDAWNIAQKAEESGERVPEIAGLSNIMPDLGASG